MAKTVLQGHVLIISENPEGAEAWSYAIRQLGCTCAVQFRLKDSSAGYDLSSYDLLIIDLFDDQMHGIQLCQELRDNFANPILVTTYERDERYSIHAYRAGVDECIIKPIGITLLVSKVAAWLRRTSVKKTSEDVLQAAGFDLDPKRHEVTNPLGVKVKLSPLEYRLFYVLLSNAGQVLTTELLVDRVWSGYGEADATVLKHLIYRLRHKIEPNPQQIRYLHTVPGQGYVFNVD